MIDQLIGGIRDAGFVVIEVEAQKWLIADRHEQGHNAPTDGENICGPEHEDEEKATKR